MRLLMSKGEYLDILYELAEDDEFVLVTKSTSNLPTGICLCLPQNDKEKKDHLLKSPS